MKVTLSRYVDQPLLAAGSWALMTLFRRCKITPVLGFFMPMLAGGTASIVIGAAIMAYGKTLDWVTGVSLIIVGVGQCVVGQFAFRAIPREYNAWTFKLLRARALSRLDERFSRRLVFLVAALVSFVAVFWSVNSLPLVETLTACGALAMFSTVTTSEYLSTAEPPDPDEGDFEQVRHVARRMV